VSANMIGPGGDLGFGLGELFSRIFGPPSAGIEPLDLSAYPLCRPGRRMWEVTVAGDLVQLSVYGPRRAVHAALNGTPDQMEALASELHHAACKVRAQLREAAEFATCAPCDVPGLPESVMPS